MQDQHVPAIGRYYWPAFAGATLFASTASDLLFMELAGHGLGDLYLPLFAGAFVALIVAETRDPGESTRWYWAAVIAAM